MFNTAGKRRYNDYRAAARRDDLEVETLADVLEALRSDPRSHDAADELEKLFARHRDVVAVSCLFARSTDTIYDIFSGRASPTVRDSYTIVVFGADALAIYTVERHMSAKNYRRFEAAKSIDARDFRVRRALFVPYATAPAITVNRSRVAVGDSSAVVSDKLDWNAIAAAVNRAGRKLTA